MYEYLMAKADEADRTAETFFQKKDLHMFIFWTSAAAGYRIKAYSLAVGDAE